MEKEKSSSFNILKFYEDYKPIKKDFKLLVSNEILNKLQEAIKDAYGKIDEKMKKT